MSLNSDRLRIRCLQPSEIDREAWDRCIAESPNGLLYGRSDYLSAMCDDWEALVWNDYEAVMPLPWRKKLGVHYLYQPFLTAQLGVFGKNLTAELFGAFLNRIPLHFRYLDLPLNAGNRFPVNGFRHLERSNYILPLKYSYEAISTRYNDNVLRNLKKAHNAGCTVAHQVPIEEIIQLAKEHTKGITWEEWTRFKVLFDHLQKRNEAFTYGVQSGSNEWLATAVFFVAQGRAYYILVGNHPEGRKLGASHLLIDTFIRRHAGTNTVLDFEGSDVPGLAQFYASFGGVEEKYPALRHNRLPFWVRWLKQ